MPISFAMNRTCAPQLPFAEFIVLAAGVGVSAVEIRNDIPGREFMDGTEPEEIREKLQSAGLSVASVNALQRFNEWTKDREAEARSLMDFAAKLRAPGVVLCPVHNPDHGWALADAEKNLRQGLRNLAPILRDCGVKGYVEPLGMAGSTLKTQAMAVAAVSDIDCWDAYQLCYDTFQYFRCGDTEIYPEHIGLAHVSGVTRTDLPPGHLTEPDRGIVEETDLAGTVSQIETLVAAGYRGFISMEPFNPAVQQSPQLRQELQSSIARISAVCQKTMEAAGK